MGQILDTDYKEYHPASVNPATRPAQPSVKPMATLSVDVEQPSTEVEDKCGLPRDNRVFTHLSLTTPYMDNSPCRFVSRPERCSLRRIRALQEGGDLSPDSVEGCLSPGWCITPPRYTRRDSMNRLRGDSTAQQSLTVFIPLYKHSPTHTPLPAHLTLYRNPIHLSLSVFKRGCS